MKNRNIHVDICVIGAGAGGLSVAAGAVQLGFDTALIERAHMGGDCLNTGCIPSKALLAAAKSAQTFRTADKFGIKALEPDVNFSRVKEHVFKAIKHIQPHDSQDRYEGLGVKVFRSSARFIDTKSIRLENQQIVSANKFVIATGSRAKIPDIKGLNPEKIFTNESIFDLRHKPEHLIIIGAGPIGVEMAQAHKRLGCEVTLIDIGPLLPKDDPELTNIIRDTLIAEGVELLETSNIKEIQQPNSNVLLDIVHNKKELQIKGSHLLIATGRQPNTDNLSLENAKVVYDEKGIKTDQRLRTSNKNIFAIGDVIGGPLFTHIAGYQAGIVISNLAFKLPLKVDYRALPWVTYTDPELAHVGYTEAQALKKLGPSINVTKWKFKDNDRAVTELRQEGLIKVISKKNGRIVGASIVGPHSGEMIGLWCLAIGQRMKLEAIARMIAPYPTFGEVSKRVAGSYYTGALFNDKTRFLASILKKIPL